MGLSDFTILATYSFPHEAELARLHLASAGIPSVLKDAETIRMDWLYSNAIGGVKLLVHRSNLEQAREVLEADYSDALDEVDFDDLESPHHRDPSAEDPDCPRCGSERVEPHTLGKATVFMTIALLGIPLFFIRRGWKCGSCGNFFRG